jgi:hypothetical protein
MKMIHKTLAASLLLAGALGMSQAAQAGSNNCPAGVDLTGNTNYVQFTDAISYSLPILGMDVQSSPGQIGGCIIVTSGPGGVLTNTGGGIVMDNAYNNEQGGTQPYFQTGTANSPDPGGAGQFPGDQASTWDISVQALESFLNGGSPIFYFNHNQVNSGAQGTTPSIDQDLFVWAQVTLYNAAHQAVLTCTLQSVPGGAGPGTGLDFNFGVPSGTPGDCSLPLVGAGTVPTQNFVRASGQVCLDNTTQDVVSCFNPDGTLRANTTSFNENLGANEVANAVLVPTLNQFLVNNPNFIGTMSIDLRMGCLESAASDAYLAGTDQAFLQNPTGNCPLGSVTNNGYEQVFITSTAAPVPLPEPQTLALFAIGLVAVAWATRRARKA